MEFTDKFVETDWCRKGIVHILDDQLEVNFNGKNALRGGYFMKKIGIIDMIQIIRQ